MPKTYRKEVTKIETQTNDKGTFKVITVRDDKGENTRNIFPAPLQAVFASPGTYDMDYEKVGKYWNIVGAKLISANGASNSNGNGHAANGNGDVSRTINSAIMAAADILAGRFRQGDFTMDDAVTYLPKLIKAGFDGAQACLEPDGDAQEP